MAKLLPGEPSSHRKCISAGASILPEAIMHFPPVSDFPPLFPTRGQFSQFYPFPKKLFDFHPPKFSDDQICNFSKFPPLFSLFQHIFPLFRKTYFPPTFAFSTF